MSGESGVVYLIGSGPGDPGLFTLKGLECIRRADAVVYDRLAPEALLAYARPEAEMIYVGKLPERHTMTQEEINALLVRLGLEGKEVVRLKGGDPFIFGRGGEEALELRAAGVPFEVVPGISSGYAVPAYAGIPVTHRRSAASVTFVTGHEDPTKDETDVDWGRLAQGADTLVLYMSVGRLAEISTALIWGGRDPQTPVACIRWGTIPEQRTVTGTLSDIAERVAAANLKPPAITVVGEVAAMHEQLNWFEERPLFGRRIVVTRSRTQAGELSERLGALGAEAVEFPTIEIRSPEDFGPLDEAIRQLHTFDWLVFTSVNGVDAFLERLGHHGLDLRSIPAAARIAAIGPATAGRLENCGLRVDVTPGEYRAEALLQEIGGSLAGQRILIPRARVAREVLPESLREAGAEVVVPPAYESAPTAEGADRLAARLRAGEIDCVTFTASSTVENFVRAFGGETAALLERTRVACIGPITAETARKHDLRVDVEAEEYTIPGLVTAVRELLEPTPAR